MLTVSDEQLAYKHRELLYRVHPWTLLTLTTVKKLARMPLFEPSRELHFRLMKINRASNVQDLPSKWNS